MLVEAVSWLAEKFRELGDEGELLVEVDMYGDRPSTVETSVFSPNATHLHNLITARAPVQLRQYR